ncbi:MAG: carboxypeptidase-like regulatory domain-containing protein [Candidatus Nanopelagicales bacterium]
MRSCAVRLRRRGVVAVLALVLVQLLLGTPPAAAELVGSVSGTVTARGAPLANAWVRLTPVTPTGDWAGQPAFTTTDSVGRYVFSDLYAFHVKIEVRAPAFSGLAGAYWPQAYSFASAQTLRVAGSGSSADIDLPVGSTISGRVVDAATGAPLAGLVTAHVDDRPGSQAVGTPGYAPKAGEFRIEGIPPVPVALHAEPPPGGNHLAQWYDGVGSHRVATMIESDRSAPVLIRLREGGQIEGTVRDETGSPVPGAIVTVIGCPDQCPLSTVVDRDGDFRLHAVPTGPGLRVFAAAGPTGQAAGLLDGWYPEPDGIGAGSFDLVTGQVQTGIDVPLITGAVLTGAVLDAGSGEPLAGVAVELVDPDNPLRSYTSRAEGAHGVRVGPVPPGRYAVVVVPGAGNRAYLPATWAASSGLAPDATITLDRALQAQFAVHLTRVSGARWDSGLPGAARGAVPRSPELADRRWPGLAVGFPAASTRWPTCPPEPGL